MLINSIMKIVLMLFRCLVLCVALSISIFITWVYAGDKKQKQDDSLKTEIVWGKDQAQMCLIPSGTFAMGTMESEINELVKQFADYEAEKAWFKSEVPRHTIEIAAFYMDKAEVTNAQYKVFINQTGYRTPQYWFDDNYNSRDLPVVGVSWYDAMQYASWSEKRLPTEAEWEYATRGGMANQMYPWGNKITPQMANYGEKVGKATVAGTYPSNGYGLYDLAGNVWEWCLDSYNAGFYKTSPRKDPFAGGDIAHVIKNFSQVDKNQVRVIRGGSWQSDPGPLRVASRGNYFPSFTLRNCGFRCVKPVNEIKRNSN